MSTQLVGIKALQAVNANDNGGTVYSEWIPSPSGAGSASIEAIWTGTITGTVSLEGSNDGGTTPKDLGVTISSPGGSAGSSLTDLTNKLFSKLYRVKYVPTNGAGGGVGTLSAFISQNDAYRY